MNNDNVWIVEANLTIETSVDCETREEAEKRAHELLAELRDRLIGDYCDSCDYEIENIFN